jgi:hypothetical protein
MLIVAYNREVGTCDGTLTIEMGNKTNNVVLAAQAGWNLLSVPSSPGQDCWYENFMENDADVKITLSGRTTGTLLVDDVLLVPFTPFDGSWYMVVGGATKFLLDDEFTWTDTATESKIQKWLWRAYGRYLPHATGSAVTVPDP